MDKGKNRTDDKFYSMLFYNYFAFIIIPFEIHASIVATIWQHIKWNYSRKHGDRVSISD